MGTILSTAGKMALKFTPEVPPKVVGAVQAASQALQAIVSLQIMGIFPIPVIPFGVAIDYVFTMIEAFFNYSRVIVAKMRKKMLELYSVQFKSASGKRLIAENKLYADLKKAQTILIAEVNAMKTELKRMQVRLPQVQKEYEIEMGLYQKTIIDYAAKAKAADQAGDSEKAAYWAEQISALDTWLAEIILKLTEKITLTIDIKFLEVDIKAKEPPTKIQLEKIWRKMAWEWSFIFNVAVPYYPDLPDYPNLPPMPPKFKIPQIVKCMAKGLAKWLASPQLPPLGVFLDALLHCLMNLIPVNVPPLAAQMESISDSLIEHLGICI